LLNAQIDAQLFSMCLFQFSTCFEQLKAHHQENQLCQYKIWYMSLCVGHRFVCRLESSMQMHRGFTKGKFNSSQNTGTKLRQNRE